MGTYQHARMQALLTAWFGSHEKQWKIAGCIALRMRVSQNRVRVPDLVVLTAGAQPEILAEPPLLVIEILSPDDTYSDTQERAQDYRAMGVETVWIIDPKTRSGRMCCGAQWVEASRLTVKGTPLYVDLPEIFGQLTAA